MQQVLPKLTNPLPVFEYIPVCVIFLNLLSRYTCIPYLMILFMLVPKQNFNRSSEFRFSHRLYMRNANIFLDMFRFLLTDQRSYYIMCRSKNLSNSCNLII